jgi:GNAT superfamily N-acetyltransferase
MSYASLQITEVGPPEYPLIATLRKTIFTEAGHYFSVPFEEGIADRQDVLALIAHLEGNPLGFKVGYRFAPGIYYSWTGGILKDYRRQGLARRMQEWQHAFARSRGYRSVFFNTFNRFHEMMLFGLDTGFVPVGIERRAEGDISVKFTKDLTKDDPPPRPPASPPPATLHVEAVSPNYHGLIADIATQTIGPTSEREIDQLLAAVDSIALVAFVGDQPAGFTIGSALDGRRQTYVSHFTAVLPRHRRRGIAGVLTRSLIESADAFGYRHVRSHVDHSNVPMLRLALSLGYDVVGILQHANAIPSSTGIILEYERSRSPAI